MALQTDARPTRAEIDLDVLSHNFRAMRELVGQEVKIMAVVKADAYGHGALQCAARLENENVDWFGVAIPEEGVALRNAGIVRPILCLGSFWPGQEQTILRHHLTPVVFNIETARSLNAYASSLGRSVDIHVKVDSGMGRVGVRYDEIGGFIDALTSLPSLKVSGLMTHFASAEDTAEDAFTAEQTQRLSSAVDAFRDAGYSPEWVDLANSPGAIAHPETRGNLVRLGGALYGLLDDIMPSGSKVPDLKPVLSLRSKIVGLKSVPVGETLGYGRTFRTERVSTIALVPVGYADGYPRALSNRGSACIRGTLAPIVGRVSMDWTLFDVTDIPEAQIGDDVTLIGTDRECSITAADLARQVDTIGYEITCGIGPRVRRVFV